jgi:hypothetical protein
MTKPKITWGERKIKDLFVKKEFIGEVLRFTILLEFELDCLLAQYFIREDRIDDGLAMLISNLAFNAKIEVFAKLPVRKSVKSFPKAVTGLRRFRKIRNIAAHSFAISSSEVSNLLHGAEYKRMLAEYPEGLQEYFDETRRSLWRLRRVKEFLGPTGDVFDWDTFAIMRMFE